VKLCVLFPGKHHATSVSALSITTTNLLGSPSPKLTSLLRVVTSQYLRAPPMTSTLWPAWRHQWQWIPCYLNTANSILTMHAGAGVIKKTRGFTKRVFFRPNSAPPVTGAICNDHIHTCSNYATMPFRNPRGVTEGSASRNRRRPRWTRDRRWHTRCNRSLRPGAKSDS
jgi:hypothetical protein